MIHEISTSDTVRKPGPSAPRFPHQVQSRRHNLSKELQRYLAILGPMPKRCLETLADLGLTDPEIARYFRIPRGAVTDLRQIWNIKGEI